MGTGRRPRYGLRAVTRVVSDDRVHEIADPVRREADAAEVREGRA